MAAAPTPDPFADVDPRVKAILQNVLAQQQQNAQPPPVATSPTPLGAPPQANGQAPNAMVPVQPPPAASAPPSAQQVQPSSLAPVSSPPQTPAGHPGPIKSFLSNFLYGGGQALLQHVGLPTDYEKQQNAQKDALAQQSANDQSQFRQAQTNQVLAKAQEYDRQRQPYVIPNDPSTYGSLAGTPTTVGNFENLSKVGFKNFGATQLQNVKNQGTQAVADTNAAAKVDAAAAKPGNDFEQFYKDYLSDKGLTDTAHNRLAARSTYAAAGQAPQRAPVVQMLMPNAQGGYTSQAVRPGMSVAPGALTPSGLNSIDTPTASTRTMAETAPRVTELADRTLQLLDANEKQLGPLKSRWDEFTAGKIGAPNQGYTQLRTDTALLQTALMRMHVGARGGGEMMEHFKDLIDSSKQDPDNLRAAIGEIKSYAQQVSKEGGRGASTAAPVSSPSTEPHPFFSKFGGTAVTPQ